MSIYILALLIGVVAALRTITAPGVTSWAAHLGWLNLQGTRLAFLGFASISLRSNRNNQLTTTGDTSGCSKSRFGNRANSFFASRATPTRQLTLGS